MKKYHFLGVGILILMFVLIAGGDVMAQTAKCCVKADCCPKANAQSCCPQAQSKDCCPQAQSKDCCPQARPKDCCPQGKAGDVGKAGTKLDNCCPAGGQISPSCCPTGRTGVQNSKIEQPSKEASARDSAKAKKSVEGKTGLTK